MKIELIKGTFNDGKTVKKPGDVFDIADRDAAYYIVLGVVKKAAEEAAPKEAGKKAAEAAAK